jgi:hypothetical protein
VEFERRAECKNTNTRKREGTKAREILKKYPEDKAKALMKRLYDRGLWYFDPDFEGDTEDHGSCQNWPPFIYKYVKMCFGISRLHLLPVNTEPCPCFCAGNILLPQCGKRNEA